MGGIALDDIHEVGDEVRTALILVLYLAPLGVHILLDAY